MASAAASAVEIEEFLGGSLVRWVRFTCHRLFSTFSNVCCNNLFILAGYMRSETG